MALATVLLSEVLVVSQRKGFAMHENATHMRTMNNTCFFHDERMMILFSTTVHSFKCSWEIKEKDKEDNNDKTFICIWREANSYLCLSGVDVYTNNRKKGLK